MSLQREASGHEMEGAHQPFLDSVVKGVKNDKVKSQLMVVLARSGLPRKLVERLLQDVDGGDHYQRVESVEHIDALPATSTYWMSSCCCTCLCCDDGFLIERGTLGKVKINDKFQFLAPGYHRLTSFGLEDRGTVNTTTVNQAVVNGSAGFVTITEGHIGVLLLGGEYRLLAPGTYQWNSPAVQFHQCVDVTAAVAKLGPFTLITIPDGMVSITYHNGDLRVLGVRGGGALLPSSFQSVKGLEAAPSKEPEVSGSAAAAAASSKKPSASAASATADLAPVFSSSGVGAGSPQLSSQRTFFLDDPKWLHSCFLSMKTQTDRLEGNDLLSRDNVEILMVAMSQWRICDPVLAINECADDMESIRTKVNQLVRATIARIVAGTNIGAGPVGGATAKPKSGGGAAHSGDEPHKDDADLAHLMQSEQASAHMKDLTHNLDRQGIEVVGVFVPEKRMKNDDIRSEVAKQAVIGIKAEAERSAADASAYATITHAKAQAEAINELARAHSDAGKRLGAPTETAARMALSEITGKSLKDAHVTLFSGTPDNMPFMFTPKMQ